MLTKTISCKLAITSETKGALEETSERFSNACNYALDIALQQGVYKQFDLQHLCYYDIRQQFELSANLTVRAIARVAACLKKLKGKRKIPKCFKPGSINYDARVFMYKEQSQSVSIMTTQGRMVIPLNIGTYQKALLAGKKPTAATVVRRGNDWYINICIDYEPTQYPGEIIAGIDLGITNIATMSTGFKVKGKSRQQFKAKCMQVRASLQSKGTKGAKKLLKKLSGKEKRRITHDNHVLSKQMVDEAKRHNCAILRMEQLKGIRDRTKIWNKHTNKMIAGWSFYQLQNFVIYKAAAVSIAVEMINPAYTSQTCHKCFALGSRNGERFKCTACGVCHADVNASHVIAAGGAACKSA